MHRFRIGYLRTGIADLSLGQQHDALIAAGVPADRIYRDGSSDGERPEGWPGLTALLRDAGRGDEVTVLGLDVLGCDAAEVVRTVRKFVELGVIVRSLRAAVDPFRAADLAGALAQWPSVNIKYGPDPRKEPERRAVGRPHALDAYRSALAQQMHAVGVPKSAIARTLGVSRPTVYKAMSAG